MADDRLYGKFTLDFPDSPKIMPLSDAAFRCLVEATLYSRRMLTDGFLPERVAVAKWGADALAELCSNDSAKPSLRQVEGGYVIHDFAEHQTTAAEVEAKKKARSEAGKKGAAKRWGKQTSGNRMASAMAGAMANGCDSDGTGNGKKWPETETETVTSNEVTLSADAEFDRAWPHWPKKVEKKNALAKFRIKARRVGADTLAEHVIRFGQAYAATTERQFVPNLASWLNGERWTDELPAPRTPQAPVSAFERARAGLINDIQGGMYGPHRGEDDARRRIGA